MDNAHRVYSKLLALITDPPNLSPYMHLREHISTYMFFSVFPTAYRMGVGFTNHIRTAEHWAHREMVNTISCYLKGTRYELQNDKKRGTRRKKYECCSVSPHYLH